MVKRTIIKYSAIVFVTIFIIAGLYIGYTTYKDRLEIKKLKKMIAHLEKETEMLKVIVEDTIMGNYDIKLAFIDNKGKPVGKMKRYTLPGNKIYIEAIILQFSYPLIEKGHKSIAFPVKIYSSSMKPDNGLPIVSLSLDENGIPLSYRNSKFLNENLHEYTPILKKLWFFANNPEKIPSKWGLKRIYGQAVFTKMVKSKYYRIIVKSTGDMAIEPSNVWWE